MTLLDTNVIVDILSDDPAWLEWSAEQLDKRRSSGPLYINEITYAELSAYARAEIDLKQALAELAIQLERTPTPALFLVGQAFRRYRAAGGLRTSVLPDFFIGAHAQIMGLSILTRDVRRFRSYFPDVTLIAPDE